LDLSPFFMNCPVAADGTADVVAYIEGPKSREITYINSGTYTVQEYFTKLKIAYQGKTLWETQWTNKALSKQLDSANRAFYEARFDIVRKKLCSENQAEWDKLPFTRKCLVIQDLIKAGILN
jgi:hypothetical protein